MTATTDLALLSAQSTEDVTETEAYKTLVARVGRAISNIPAECLARHVMQIVPAHEWPVRVEALDALLRRLESARKDELRIEKRPENGQVLGLYSTRRRGSEARPYRTIVLGADPLQGRCDCPDYLRNSLGLCKHLLAVLNHVHARPGLVKQARKEQDQNAGTKFSGPVWDPVRPLLGLGDWLERVNWVGATVENAKGNGSRAAQALGWFKPGPNGCWSLRKTYHDDPARRLELVEAILKVVPAAPTSLRHDPALRALLVSERTRLKRLVEKTLWPSEQRAALRALKCTLYPYQRDGVKRFLETGRLLLADDMGLGKTAQAIACCEILCRSGRVRKGLVIAPAALKPQWAREWAHFSDLPVEVIDGTPTERQALYASRKEGFFIINYEQLLRDLEPVRAWDPDLVVLDEAQRIKNWATKTALSVKGLSPPYRLVLTGTPMENRIEELASIVEWVDDHALEPKWRLPALHAIRCDGRKEISGVRHLDTLRLRLQLCMVRRVRQDVLDQLPPRTDVRVPVEMTEAQMEEHDALIQPIAELMSIAERRPLTQAEFLRLMSLLTTQRIISNGLAQVRFEQVWPSIRKCAPEESMIKGLAAPKLLELRQLVRQLVIDQGRKVVVFSQWRRMLHLAHWAVTDLLTESKLRAGFFTGAEKQKRRTQNIVEFHDDPDFRILFASDAGGVGLNLQRAANCVINLELPWNPAVLEQRIGRIYRLGQKLPIDVYNLVCEQGIEARIADLVGNKQAFFKGLFDGDSDSVKFESSGSFLARVKKLYDPATLAASTAVGGNEEIELTDLADASLDDDVADPFDAMIEAADESDDRLAVTAEPTAEPFAALPAPQDNADEAGPADLLPPEPKQAALPRMEDVRGLFAQLQVRRQADGHVIIEAPPEAASTLSALFEGMAALLQQAAEPSR
jgi:superfamily II DNA or RNA helicase